MMRGSGSLTNPFQIDDVTIAYQNTYVGRGNGDITAKTAVDPRLVAGESTAVILVIGQSESTNYPSTPQYSPYVNAKAHNLNLLNGGIYQASDPLLGCGSTGGNWVGQCADKLITAAWRTRVIMVPIALGGVSAAEWAPGGICNHRVLVALRRLTALGLAPNYVCYQQGVTDALIGTTGAAYTASVSSLFSQLRTLGVSCPILIAKSTWTAGAANTTIQTAQVNMVDVPSLIYAGADCDSLDNTNRVDGTHWNATGRAACAELWKVKLAAL